MGLNRVSRSQLLKLANKIAVEHGQPKNGRIKLAVMLGCGQLMKQRDCWAWLTEEYHRRIVAGIDTANERVKVQSSAKFYASEEWRAMRYTALRQSAGRCVLCGRSTREHGVVLHVDHIKPRSLFPKLALTLSNLQVLCADCNLGKSNTDEIDWR